MEIQVEMGSQRSAGFLGSYVQLGPFGNKETKEFLEEVVFPLRFW
jgi:hypothetical protein